MSNEEMTAAKTYEPPACTATTVKRAILTIIGILILGTAVSFVTVANLGTATVSTVPFVLNRLTPFTIGQLEMALNILCLIIELIILKGKLHPVNILVQIGLAVGIGVIIDTVMPIITKWLGEPYWFHLLYLVIGMVLTGFAISLMVQARMMMPLDALVELIARLSGKTFGFVKTIFDVTLTAITCIIGLIFLHTIVGVREGTVACALLVGIISNFFLKILRPTIKMY